MSSRRRQSVDVEDLLELVKDTPGVDVIMEELQSGKSAEQILKEAIDAYVMIRKVVFNMNTDQLIASFFFWDMVQRRVLYNILASGFVWKMLLASFLQWLEVYSNIYATAKEAQTEEARTKLVEEFIRFMRRQERRLMQMMKNMQMPMLFPEQPTPKSKSKSKSRPKKEEVKVDANTEGSNSQE